MMPPFDQTPDPAGIPLAERFEAVTAQGRGFP